METESPASAQWALFFDRCLQRRIQLDDFYDLARQLCRRTPILGIKLADVLIGRQEMIPNMPDPLIPCYAEALLERRRVSSADLMGALYRRSKCFAAKNAISSGTETYQKGVKVYNTPELESTIFDALTRAYLPGGGCPTTQTETNIALVLLAEWLSACVARGTALADESDHQVLMDAMSVFQSLGALSIAMLENPKVIGIIDHRLSKDHRKKLSQALTSYVSFWSTAAPQHASNAARIDLAQKNRGLIEQPIGGSQDAALDVAAAMQVEAVVDLQMVHTRPHVFILFSALLASCPLTDESMIMNYLHARYSGDAQSLGIDLILASFDAIAAASDRNDSQHMFSLKSFLINKVPLLIATLNGSLLTPEFVIQQALSQVDLNAFPTIALGMLQSNTALQDTRQDFVYSCILHGLLNADSVGRLLGESTFDSPPSPQNRLHKDFLLQQCATEPGKVVQLISALEKLDGNAGAIVGAVVEVIRSACSSKDTMSLKSICNALAAKPQYLDLVLQFTSAASVLQPLCQLVDGWKYEDDQGESQPVYDEFASVFLLILTFVYRFDFSHAEMGISRDSFVGRYLAQGHQDHPAGQLSEEQSRHLGNWIKGLFDPDGITEEVTASCQPQQFYMLMPTIFSQTVMACSAGVLGIETVKTGLEYLSEPFLLPSLVDAIHWTTSYVRGNPNTDVDMILKILQQLTRAPTSGEAQAMHSTIMAIVTLPLINCLRTLRKTSTKRSEVDQLLQSLKPHLGFRRGIYGPCPQLSSWTGSQGGLRATLKNTLQSLINWSLQITAMNPAQLPPSYNHRLFIIAELMLGANDLLSIILEELKEQTENPGGAAAVAIDIATALVCAPKVENSPIEVTWPTSAVPAQHSNAGKRLNMRDALALRHGTVTEIMKTDQTMAATIVRLHRRVEAQAAISITPLPDITVQMPAPDVQQMLDGLAAAAAVPEDPTAVQQQQQPTMDFSTDASLAGLGVDTSDPMQLDMGDTGADDGMEGLLGGGTGGMGVDDDVFGDLDLSNLDGMGDMYDGF